MKTKESGHLVEIIADGRIGRTRRSDKAINGKLVVYLETTPNSFDYSEKGTLFSPEQIKLVGFID